jgi:hypothetical protein
MFLQILKIAILCIVLGGASIPVSFAVNSNPFIVWGGNALGSLLSAVVVIYVGNRITNQAFKDKVSRWRVGKKIIVAYDDGGNSKKVIKARVIINKHGLRLFSLVCPIFPGVLVSTIAVFILDLDLKVYKRWMFAGVILVSGFYVFSYWFLLQHA